MNPPEKTPKALMGAEATMVAYRAKLLAAGKVSEAVTVARCIKLVRQKPV